MRFKFTGEKDLLRKLSSPKETNKKPEDRVSDGTSPNCVTTILNEVASDPRLGNSPAGEPGINGEKNPFSLGGETLCEGGGDDRSVGPDDFDFEFTGEEIKLLDKLTAADDLAATMQSP